MAGLVVTIYLIHAEVPVKHARHYLGVTQRDSLLPRLTEHLNGKGSVLVQLFAQVAGITTADELIRMVVAQWAGTRGEERRMKNKGTLAKVCPICRAVRGLGPYVSQQERRLNGSTESVHQD